MNNSDTNKGLFYGWGRVYLTCLHSLRLLVNPPLQVIENGDGESSQLHPLNPLQNPLPNFLLLYFKQCCRVSVFPCKKFRHFLNLL